MLQRFESHIMSDDRLSTLSGNAVTVRGLTPELKARLRVRAAHNARSMEAEARAILEAALSAPDDDTTDLGAFARGLFAPIGGIELELPSRAPPRQAPELDEARELMSETAGPPLTVALLTPEPTASEKTDAVPVTAQRRRR